MFNEFKSIKKLCYAVLGVTLLLFIISCEDDHDHDEEHTDAEGFILESSSGTQVYKEFKGTLQGPGGISWTYGEGGRQVISTVHQFPKSGDMYIFPAGLRHWVFPFKSNVERISVSGNLLIDADYRMNYYAGK